MTNLRLKLHVRIETLPEVKQDLRDSGLPLPIISTTKRPGVYAFERRDADQEYENGLRRILEKYGKVETS